MNQLYLLIPAIITGAAVPFQAGANAALGRSLGHPLWATAVSLLVSLICIIPIMLAARIDTPLLTAAAQAPRWIWIGGLVGALYVTGALIIAPMLGAANFIVAIILGQLLASAALDQWGLMGFPKQPVTPTRVLGLSVVFVGILVMQWQTIIGSSSRG
ncbi:DMT family transporter [Agrobacterium tumefaciens]|uniref:DMT family transporter n=1 Tax=Agrobacterium tumefaciens TaxID=358 RepID=UPI00129B5A15|nr:DMT family transporter [Agrobacterium tumefaciens]MRH98209.1 EamA-like transporter family protein [Agrobacterium tumefaciens]